eukprot:4991-Heterococcus_DN1.PRE.1
MAQYTAAVAPNCEHTCNTQCNSSTVASDVSSAASEDAAWSSSSCNSIIPAWITSRISSAFRENVSHLMQLCAQQCHAGKGAKK